MSSQSGQHTAARTRTFAGRSGPARARRLNEYPQTFETFGGWSAGGLLDIVTTSEGPAIAYAIIRSGDGVGLWAADL
jgi:hypothetical protein